MTCAASDAMMALRSYDLPSPMHSTGSIITSCKTENMVKFNMHYIMLMCGCQDQHRGTSRLGTKLFSQNKERTCVRGHSIQLSGCGAVAGAAAVSGSCSLCSPSVAAAAAAEAAGGAAAAEDAAAVAAESLLLAPIPMAALL